MTEIEYIEVDGFKGLEHVEFEPTDVNLITGRNNTGKTSILEAIDILFNPANIEKFGEDVDRVVNINRTESVICASLDDTDTKVTLRPPTDDEILDFFAKAMAKTLQLPTEFLFLVQGSEPQLKDEEFANEMSDMVAPIVNSQFDSQEDIDTIKEDFLVISTDNGVYPYFSAGERSSEIISLVYEEIEEELLEYESNLEEVSDSEESSDNTGSLPNLGSETDNFITEVARDLQSQASNQFLDSPKNTQDAYFLSSIDFTEGIENVDNEENAIKIDNIGDYIRESGLVDNFKSFNPNYLVFEDGSGEKYQIPIDFMGDGFKSITGLLWELMDKDIQNNIVLLEEPENHMHPGYIREVVYFLINLAREEDVQLFITTHDSDFINDFFTENLTDEEKSYLEDEFSLLRMEEDSAVVEDYETARENLKELHLDLRGI